MQRKNECCAFEINVENDAHHTLGSTQSNRTLFVHCQTFYLSQCLLFAWPTSTMHSMNIYVNRLYSVAID